MFKYVLNIVLYTRSMEIFLNELSINPKFYNLLHILVL
jgi:hypothetical protein